MANSQTSSTDSPANRQDLNVSDTSVGNSNINDPNVNDQSVKAPNADIGSLETADLEILRQLILGDAIAQTLNSSLQAEAVSRVLPGAIAQASYQENELTRALMPTIEKAIKESVRLDEKILAEVMFPIIGPATRKSIGAAIDGLLQSLNQTLEYSVSAKSLSWRWEAFRTGKTFAEVVMLRTLVFQVEQVLLIHKETGLLLLQRVNENVKSQDPDLVSAMLTAIKDFVQDSFSVESGDSLEALALGDLNIWIEEGPHAILACVVRGRAPAGLRTLLRGSQEKIQRLFGEPLENFAGDPAVLKSSAPYLDDCLHFRFEGQPVDEEKRVPLSKGRKTFLWAIAVIIATAIGIRTFLNYQVQQNWNTYLTDLEQQPGLVVISQHKQGQYVLSGLRDPLAVDPVERLAIAHLQPEQVKMSWRPYWSLEPELADKRMQALLSLVSSERENLEVWRSRIESRRLQFQPAKAVPVGHDLDLLIRQADDIAVLAKQASAVGEAIEITVQAYGDRRGTQFSTADLGLARASYVKRVLVSRGISATTIKAKHLAFQKEDLADLRGSAVFKVKFTR